MDFLELFVLVVVFAWVMLYSMRNNATQIDKILLRQRREHISHYKWLLAGGGLAVLALIGIQTVREARSIDWKPENVAFTIKAPTRPVELEAVQSNPTDARGNIKSARLLCTLLFYDQQPLYVETFELKWPLVDSFSRTVDVSGRQVTFISTVEKAYYTNIESRDRFTAEARIACHYKGFFMRHGSFSGVFQINQCSTLGAISINPFKLWLSQIDNQYMQVLLFVMPAAHDDPLQEIPITDLLNNPNIWPGQEKILKENYMITEWNPEPDVGAQTGIFFIDFVTRFTIPFLVFCFTVPFLTAPFRNKAAAVVAIMTLGVFYFVALDRMVLNTHLNALKNGSSSTEQQKQAMVNSTETFFYRNTAAEAIQAVIDRAETDNDLRVVGTRAVDALVSNKILRYNLVVDSV